MNDKIKIIREACIKANPEIVELKFGCEVKKDGEVYTVTIVKDTGTFKNTLEDYLLCVSKSGQAAALEKWVRIEIIGRPIRLPDILLVIPEKFGWAVMGKKYCFFSENGTPICDWNLKDDNLEHQSPETIKFINDILHHE